MIVEAAPILGLCAATHDQRLPVGTRAGAEDHRCSAMLPTAPASHANLCQPLTVHSTWIAQTRAHMDVRNRSVVGKFCMVVWQGKAPRGSVAIPGLDVRLAPSRIHMLLWDCHIPCFRQAFYVDF